MSVGAAYVDHRHADELEAIDALLEPHPRVLDLVLGDLPKGRSGTASGRPGMTAEQVLRAAILKQMHQLSHEGLAFALADSISFRRFCRLGAGQPTPKRATLQGNIKRISAVTFEAVNRVLVAGHARELGVEDGSKVRVDCTVVNANIHHPLDSTLIWDCVRVLARTMARGRDGLGLPFSDHRRRAKRRVTGIRKAKTKQERDELYGDLLKVLRKTLVQAEAMALRLGECRGQSSTENATAAQLAGVLDHYIPLARRVGEQAHRRIVLGEHVPAEEKVVSIFEDHADIIVKDRRDTLYGHEVCLASGPSNLILDAVVLSGNPADVTLTQQMVQRQQRLYGHAPTQVVFDRGFASKENLTRLRETGVRGVVFHARSGMKPLDMAASRRVYETLRDFRAGIEAGISFLKRCFGLRTCTWRSFASFQAYTWVSILSANLLTLARHVLVAPG